MNAFQLASLLYALLLCMALMTACSNPGYNNNPSQQITNAGVGCLAATEFFAVYFSVHTEPSNENPTARITKELFRSYCNDIPTPGTVFFTADLVGRELRRVPIGIRIVEQELTGYDETRAENFKDLRTLLDMPPKRYSKGVVESAFDVNKNGYYAIYLNRGGDDAVAVQDNLRIPLYVGVGSVLTRLTIRIVTLFGIALGLALIGLVALRYRRGRKTL